VQSIDDEVREMARRNCDHICHRGRALNNWVERCPVCGCPNANYALAAPVDDPARLRMGRRWVPKVRETRGRTGAEIRAAQREKHRAKLLRRAERHRRGLAGRRP
jgi:hypothetical protein